ncbi:MAG TPA: dephospho-CoA kinase [Planctomycetota bacterium]|nr:dephospho-CoA kinase [Planctomycetota bacterium]
MKPSESPQSGCPHPREGAPRHHGPIIGLSGAVAAGKSMVARLLAQKTDAALIDADDIAHHVLAADPEVKRRIIERWGDGVLNDGREISRAKLASIVFSNADELAELNRIIHPGILNEIRRTVQDTRKQAPERWIVLDAALLFETGLNEICDVMIFVESSWNTRAQRAKLNRGWDSEELDRRQQAQLPAEYKRNCSQHTVNNDGSRYETERQIERIVKLIKRHRREFNG